MIEKNINIIYDPNIKRIINYSLGDKQINLLDQRFYSRNEEYYPSVTSILDYFPKGKFFYDWVKEVGFNSEFIAQKAADEGTEVHKAIDKFLKGEEIKWINSEGRTQFSLEVWKMILKFADFWNKYKPTLITSEYHLFSDVHKYAGTTDIVCRLKDQIWLIDTKTSNSIHTSQQIQLAAYAEAWDETHNEKIEKIGILWLKAKTKKDPKEENTRIQGKGWQLLEPEMQRNDLFRIFLNIYEIYRMENPNQKPRTMSFPVSIKMD